MDKYQIGQELMIQENFEIKASLSGTKTSVQKGDKGFVDSLGIIHYTSGKARGKNQKLRDIELDGYDTENIAKLIYNRLNRKFSIADFLEGYDIETKDILSEIENMLDDILV